MYPACVPCRLAFAKAASVCRHSLMSWSGIGKIVHVKVLCCFARLVMLAIVLASPSVGDGSICCPWLTWTAKSGRVSLASHSPAPNTDFKEEVSAALIVTKGDSAVHSFGLVIFSANSSWLTWIAKVLGSCTSSDPLKCSFVHCPLPERKNGFQRCDRLLKQSPVSTQQNVIDVYPHDSS